MRFEDQLWEDDFPFVALEVGLVVGVGAFAVPGGDGEDRCIGAAHVGRWLVAGGEGADLDAVAIEESPWIGVFAYLEAVAWG